MSSTEEDNVLLRQSQEVGVRDSEVDVESVVESVIRGEEKVDDSGGNVGSDKASVVGGQHETGEAVANALVATTVRGFGEKNAPEDDVIEADVESCKETGSYHCATIDDRHDIDYLASKKGKLFQKLGGGQPFLGFFWTRSFYVYFSQLPMMMSWMKIIVRVSSQNLSTRRKRSPDPVECFRRAVSCQLNVCGWLILFQGLFRGLLYCWTALARTMDRRLFLLLGHLKVGIPSSFLLSIVYFAGVVCIWDSGTPFYVSLFCVVLYSRWSGARAWSWVVYWQLGICVRGRRGDACPGKWRCFCASWRVTPAFSDSAWTGSSGIGTLSRLQRLGEGFGSFYILLSSVCILSSDWVFVCLLLLTVLGGL